ncbi:unnamed protein product [Lathyrus sativus]|nr:unnamed protein product [Lathyrus sativus]
MQETSKEIPAGSLPRSLDVILRHEIVEHASAGDTVIFTGTVIVIPDILALASPGERSEFRREASQRKGSSSGNEGVRGLRAFGVRDLTYRLAFIANSVQVGYLCFIIGLLNFYDVTLAVIDVFSEWFVPDL